MPVKYDCKVFADTVGSIAKLSPRFLFFILKYPDQETKSQLEIDIC